MSSATHFCAISYFDERRYFQLCERLLALYAPKAQLKTLPIYGWAQSSEARFCKDRYRAHRTGHRTALTKAFFRSG